MENDEVNLELALALVDEEHIDEFEANLHQSLAEITGNKGFFLPVAVLYLSSHSGFMKGGEQSKIHSIDREVAEGPPEKFYKLRASITLLKHIY